MNPGLKSKIFRHFLRYYLNLAKYLFRTESRTPVNSSYPEIVKASGMLGHSRFDTFRYFSNWKEAEDKWNQGLYFESVRHRKEILHEVYEKQKIRDTEYFPPFLSKEFGTAFGHVGIMAAHLEASKNGIIPKGTRLVLLSNELASQELVKSILREYQRVPTENCGEILDTPPSWHIAERLQMVKGVHGFIDIYEMLQTLYSKRKVNKDNPILSLDSDYETRAHVKLNELGLPLGAWFVSLHVRNSGPAGLRRNQPIQSYLPAIEYIISQGGFVIRIGNVSMEPLPKFTNLIDLSRSTAYYWLHPFVLANGIFHIGTSSGPDAIPSLFGVPTLITNTTSIGRNMYSLCEGSLYIPKHIDSKSERWSLRRILMSPEAYSEKEINTDACGYQLEPNSDLEILFATKEIYESILRQSSNEIETYMDEINKIRLETKAVGFGKIARSFIEMNSESFLK